MQKLRKILFYLFAAAYLFLCPFLIMYAMGYIMKPGEETQIVRTGALYVATAPSGGEINISGEFSGKKTPNFIQGIEPGEKEVLITLEGYLDWKAVLSFEKGKTTVVDTILFVPVKRIIDRASKLEYKAMRGIRGADKALLETGKKISGIFVYDFAGQEEAKPVFAQGLEEDYVTGRIFTIEESPYALIIALNKDGEKYFWVELDQDEPQVTDVTYLFEREPAQVKWENGNEDEIFVLEKGKVSKIDIKNGAVYPAIAEGVRGYGLYSGKIYFLGQDNELFATDHSGKNRRDIMNDLQVAQEAFPKDGLVDIEIMDRDLFIFKGEKGELSANKLPYKFVDSGVLGMEFDSASSRLLVWEKENIGVIDFGAEETGQTEFEKAPSVKWLYKGRDINGAFWVYQASHVLFLDGGSLMLMSVLDQGNIMVSGVAGGNIDDFIYSENDGTVYFLDSEDGGVYSTVIVPSKSFIPNPLDIPAIKKTSKITEENGF